MIAAEMPRFSVPGHCLMFPGRRRDPRGFFMFDTVLDGPTGDMHVGISAEGLRTIADRHGARLGIARVEELEAARTHESEMADRLATAEAELAELRDFKEKVVGLTADGFKIQRRQGRPPVNREVTE